MPRRRDYVCSATAFLILLAGPDVYTPGVTSGAPGASLTQFAVAAELGAWTALPMSVLVVAAVVVGVLAGLTTVSTIADIAMGRMAAVNLVAVILLGRWALGALRDVERHAGRAEDVPPFRGSDNPDLPGDCGSEGRAPPVAPPLTGLCEHSPLTSGARRARRR